MIRLAISVVLVGACSTSSPGTLGDDDDDDGTGNTADTITSDPNLSAFFAVPLADGTPDAALEAKVIELASQAVAGSQIRIAMFKWSRKNVAQAFIDAANRGVDVQIVLDKEANPAAADDDDPEDQSDVNAAITMLQQPPPLGLSASAVTLCTRGNGSCQGTDINHNKFYTFSALADGSNNVVVQSSANLTTHLLHNNLVIARNDKALYDGYLAYFADLQRRKLDLDYYRTVDGDRTIAYFFPRADGDTIVSVLDKVDCTASSRVRVAMAFFDEQRHAIADRLVALEAKHCDVQVLMRSEALGGSAQIRETLRHGNVEVGIYPAGHGVDIHSKYLLIDSRYNASKTKRQLVFTGSHNYQIAALRDNDETLLRVEDPTVFAAFMDNWNTIRAQIPARDFGLITIDPPPEATTR